MSDSVQPHRRRPTRLPHPWDSPGENTGVGCHFLLQWMKVKSEREVAQSFRLLVTPWTAAYQAPPSMGFSRQEYWSGVPLPSLGRNPSSRLMASDGCLPFLATPCLVAASAQFPSVGAHVSSPLHIRTPTIGLRVHPNSSRSHLY